MSISIRWRGVVYDKKVVLVNNIVVRALYNEAGNRESSTKTLPESHGKDGGSKQIMGLCVCVCVACDPPFTYAFDGGISVIWLRFFHYLFLHFTWQREPREIIAVTLFLVNWDHLIRSSPLILLGGVSVITICTHLMSLNACWVMLLFLKYFLFILKYIKIIYFFIFLFNFFFK